MTDAETSADLRSFEQEVRLMKFRFPAPKVTPRRKESMSSNASSRAASPSSPPDDTRKDDTSNLNKSGDSKATDSDSGSSTAVVPASPEGEERIQEKPKEEHVEEKPVEEEADWEEHHYHCQYAEDLISRWRSDYAVEVPGKIVEEQIGKPNISKDSTKEPDFWSAGKLVDYVMDRVPEDLFNVASIEKWDSHSYVPKPRTKVVRPPPKKYLIPPSLEDARSSFSNAVVAQTLMRSRSNTLNSDDSREESVFKEEPLFSSEEKPILMENKDSDGISAEALLLADEDEDKTASMQDFPSTSRYFNGHGTMGEMMVNKLEDEIQSLPAPTVKPFFPVYIMDKSPLSPGERSMLSVLCALCDIQSCNVANKTWFRQILAKAETTLMQLKAIENRRRLELENAGELRNRLKNRIAVLNAKKKCFTPGMNIQSRLVNVPQRTQAHGSFPSLTTGSSSLSMGRMPQTTIRPQLPIGNRQPIPLIRRPMTMGSSVTGPPLLTSVYRPSTNVGRPSEVTPGNVRRVYKRYRLKDGRVITVPADRDVITRPATSTASSSFGVVRTNATKPYYVVQPKKSITTDGGIPATALLEEDEPTAKQQCKTPTQYAIRRPTGVVPVSAVPSPATLYRQYNLPRP